MSINKRIRDIMEESNTEDLLENVKPMEESAQPISVQPAKPAGWSSLLQKMDHKGPPLKKKQTRIDRKLQPPKQNTTPNIYFQDIGDYFDPWKHGYCMLKSEMFYKFPDGSLHRCTGVDEFGPFKSMPVCSWKR